MYSVGCQSRQLSALHKSKNTTDNPTQFTSKDHLGYQLKAVRNWRCQQSIINQMVNWENKVTLVLCLQSLISNAQFQFPSVYLSSFFENPSPKGLCLSLAVIILFTQSEDHLEKYLPKVDKKSDMEVFLKNKNPSIHLAKFSLVQGKSYLQQNIPFLFFFLKN